MQIEPDQLLSAEEQNEDSQDRKGNTDVQLKAECPLYSLVILAAVKLCTKNPGTGYCPENCQIIYQQKLVHNRNAGHLLRSDTPHHNIVQKTHKVRDAVLNHDRHNHPKNHRIECTTSN